jgi:FkbM family methyltransferase
MGSNLATRAASYLEVHPIGAADRLSLYSALLRAANWRTSRRPGYIGPGQFLRRPIRVRVRDSVFELRPASDDLEYVLPRTKQPMVAWFCPNRGDFVVEVGAHIGFNTLKAAVRGAKVVAYEPNPLTFDALLKNVALNRVEGVHLVCAAAGSRPDSGELRVPLLANGFGSLRPDWVDEAQVPSNSPIRRIDVQILRLDDSVAELGWPRIDWLLVDAEGAEVEVLAGAPVTLSRANRVIIEVDVHSAHPSAERVADILQRSGLTIVGRFPQYVRTEYWLAARDIPK